MVCHNFLHIIVRKPKDDPTEKPVKYTGEKKCVCKLFLEIPKERDRQET